MQSSVSKVTVTIEDEVDSDVAIIEKPLKTCFLSCLILLISGSLLTQAFQEQIGVVMIGATLIFGALTWAIFGIYRYNRARRAIGRSFLKQ